MPNHAPSEVTRDDIEHGLRQLRGEVIDSAQDQAPRLIPLAIGVGVAALALAFLAGRRVGRKRSTIVEIRRF